MDHNQWYVVRSTSFANAVTRERLYQICDFKERMRIIHWKWHFVNGAAFPKNAIIMYKVL